MVKIAKQTMRASKVNKNGTVRDRIIPVIEMGEIGIRINIYGKGKSGKTRLASTFPKPMLLIGTENGTQSVRNIKGLDFVNLKTSAELDDLVDMLREGMYKSVGLDTAGGLQDMILKEILGLEDMPVQKTWGIAKQQDWGTCGAQTKERLKSLLDLAEMHSTHVVIIAHERTFSDENNSDLIMPTVGAALTPSVTNWLNGACDYICQTFIRQGEVRRKVKIGTKVIEKVQKQGTEFCLRVGPDAVFMTGFRLPPGSIELPSAVVNPTFEKIHALMQGKEL